MNRLELERLIKVEGLKRGIIVTECHINDFGKEGLNFYPEIKNERRKGWVCSYKVEELIDDLAPIERPHKIGEIRLANRDFKVGEEVEVDDIWIYLEDNEKEDNVIISRSCCGNWRQGWVKGKVIETPEQNDRTLVIKLNRDIWIEEKHEWWGTVQGLEQAIKYGKIKKIEKGKPVYIGTGRWEVRKVK